MLKSVGEQRREESKHLLLRVDQEISAKYDSKNISYDVDPEKLPLFLKSYIITWEKQVSGVYENYVKEWLLSNNIPALYELKFDLNETFIHTPDFITGLMTDDGRIVLINPHHNLNRKFTEEQIMLRKAGFYVIVISKDRCNNCEGFADECWYIESDASAKIQEALANASLEFHHLREDELIQKLIEERAGDFIMTKKPESLLRNKPVHA
ncbi:MAG: hypothetical protein ACP5SA_00195 [Candidatus Micrarchaeia archaeon]